MTPLQRLAAIEEQVAVLLSVGVYPNVTLQSYAGPPGDIGLTGEKGDKGDTGLTGNVGLTGNTGNAGAQGVPGIQGVAGPQGVPGTPGDSLARLLSDATISAAGFVDIGNLQLPLLANAAYHFEFFLVFQTSTTTMGVQIALNGPAAPTLIFARSEKQINGPGTTMMSEAVLTAYDIPVPVAAAEQFAATSMLHVLRGIVLNGPNAGVLAARLSKENVAGIATIKAGSFVKWRQI